MAHERYDPDGVYPDMNGNLPNTPPIPTSNPSQGWSGWFNAGYPGHPSFVAHSMHPPAAPPHAAYSSVFGWPNAGPPQMHASPPTVMAPPSWPPTMPHTPNYPANFTTLPNTVAGTKLTAKGGPIMLVPLLCSDRASGNGIAPMRWDCRYPTNQVDFPSLPYLINQDLTQIATAPPVTRMFIIHDHLPYTITIKKFYPVRVIDVLEAIYEALQEKMTVSEYLCCTPDKRRKLDERAASDHDKPWSSRKPIKKNGTNHFPRLRVDYLGDLTLFRGLYDRPKLVEMRCAVDFEGDMKPEETWCMDLFPN